MFLRDLYRDVKESFAAQKIDNAALDARILIAHALHLSHEDFILQQDRKLSPEEIGKINFLIAQRLQYKPVAKIIGYREFYGRRFMTTEDTLDPRPDSEILIESVLKKIKNAVSPAQAGVLSDEKDPRFHGDYDNEKVRILDLGTGTGCLVLTVLAEKSQATGVAVDRSDAALSVAKKNAENLQLAERIEFLQSDWFEKITGKFDVIISNPPYIPSHEIEKLSHDVKHHDPLEALDGGADGLDPYRLIANHAQPFLHPGGLIAFEVGMGQATDVAVLLKNKGFQAIQIVNDLAGIARVVLALRP